MIHPFLFVLLARKQEAMSSVSGNLLKKQLNSAKLNDMDLASITESSFGPNRSPVGFWMASTCLTGTLKEDDCETRIGFFFFFSQNVK